MSHWHVSRIHLQSHATTSSYFISLLINLIPPSLVRSHPYQSSSCIKQAKTPDAFSAPMKRELPKTQGSPEIAYVVRAFSSLMIRLFDLPLPLPLPLSLPVSRGMMVRMLLPRARWGSGNSAKSSSWSLSSSL